MNGKRMLCMPGVDFNSAPVMQFGSVRSSFGPAEKAVGTVAFFEE